VNLTPLPPTDADCSQSPGGPRTMFSPAILEALRGGPKTTDEIRARTRITRGAIVDTLLILSGDGLVVRGERGEETTYCLNAPAEDRPCSSSGR